MPVIRIFGAGVRAACAVDLITWQFSDQFEVEGYYEDRPREGGTGPGGFPILGTFADGLREMPHLDRWAFLAVGTRASALGCRLLGELRSRDVRIASLVSPDAHVSPSAVIGDNAFVEPGVFIGTEVYVGDLVSAHCGAVVGHHSRLGHNVLVAASVAIASFCRIESHCFLGVGCRVLPEVEIGTGSLVGAGATVSRNIPPHMVACGQPAVPIRRTGSDDELPTADEISMLAAMGFA